MSIVPDHMEKVEEQAVQEIIEHVLAVEETLTRTDGTAYGDVLLHSPEERVLWYMDLARRPDPMFSVLTFLPDIDEWAKTSTFATFVGNTAEEYREQFEEDVAKVELPNGV